ncbi:hypothetical protein RV04_GL001451 [Enterococcus hermanniensis]|uniref:Uncharacterized protein n=2 Tax=Enterococcus hermanniensis TaxID=249189 RepID=A0A1L8TPM7_9ENTE|nr:hypothetical protein RV04_GL001451 [Enterococcus hermanniensis]
MKGVKPMKFEKNSIQYRVTLDTEHNQFIVYDLANTEFYAQGSTIEQAVAELERMEINS